MNKKIKNKIIEQLDLYFLNQTGYRKINGGYAELKKVNIKKLKNNWYNITGYLISGECDMGDGHSVEYTDEIKLTIKIDKNKITDIKNLEGI